MRKALDVKYWTNMKFITAALLEEIFISRIVVLRTYCANHNHLDSLLLSPLCFPLIH